MEDLCQRIPHVFVKIFCLVENQTLIKCKESSREICNLLENERFFWIRIIQAYAGSIQDSWKKVVDKAPIAIIKEFAVSIQKFLNLSFKYYVEVKGSESGHVYKDSGLIWSPLYIAAEIGHYELCKYIATKTADKSSQ